MTEEFLYAPQVRTAVQHVSGEGMAYAMEGKILEKLRLDLMFLHNL